MNIREIEDYLSIKNNCLNLSVKDEIARHKADAVQKGIEDLANYLWCLEQVFVIKDLFLKAFKDIKRKNYEDAWMNLDKADIYLGDLENNFEVTVDGDKYQLEFIGKQIKEYQKLFPYQFFLSRENVIIKEKCSICGKEISLRKHCQHRVGKLYMGEICCRIVTESKLLGISIVTDPFDRYAYIKLPDKEYNYEALDLLMTEVASPYDPFYIQVEKIIKPEYKGVQRNDKCPCNSGKKYKKCHLGTPDELADHYIINFNKKKVNDNKIRFIPTWKE